MTSLEKKWVLYDVGNSAFTLLVSTIMPIYFDALAEGAGISSVNYLAYWGYATSIATIIVAILGPTMGTLSDLSGMRKKIFLGSLLVGSIGCVVLGFMQSWLWFLVLFIISKSAYSLSLVVYDSMLTDITTPDRMDEVSAQGYAWGYIGSCIPFIACLLLVLFYDSLGITMTTAMSIGFCLIAIWWLILSLPLYKAYKQVHSMPSHSHPVKTSASNFVATLKEIVKDKRILLFLIAFFCYIDGVYTIIDMATAYGTALGLDTTGLLLALLLTQIVAFPAALIFGKLSRKIDISKLILVCIAAYCAVAIYAIGLTQLYQFWILAVCVGIFQGAIQSMSRSFYAKIIPAEKSGEYFGIYDICGKGAAFMGTTLVSFVSQVTGSVNLGVGALSIMFVLGFIFFILTMRASKAKTAVQNQ